MTQTGRLIYDEQSERYDICFDNGEYYGGLHCGDCFDVLVAGEWITTAIELNAADEWYLTDAEDVKLDGLRVCVD